MSLSPGKLASLRHLPCLKEIGAALGLRYADSYLWQSSRTLNDTPNSRLYFLHQDGHRSRCEVGRTRCRCVGEPMCGCSDRKLRVCCTELHRNPARSSSSDTPLDSTWAFCCP